MLSIIVATRVDYFIRGFSMFLNMIRILPIRFITRTNHKTSSAVFSSTDPHFIAIDLGHEKRVGASLPKKSDII